MASSHEQISIVGRLFLHEHANRHAERQLLQVELSIALHYQQHYAVNTVPASRFHQHTQQTTADRHTV